jgi:hypothetical protein
MGPESLVKYCVEDGRKLLELLSLEGFDVTVGFWLKADDSDRWYLHIASRSGNTDGMSKAYKFVHGVIARHPEIRIDRFVVKLVGLNHPLVKSVLEFQSRYPASGPQPFCSVELSGSRYGEAVIYRDCARQEESKAKTNPEANPDRGVTP